MNKNVKIAVGIGISAIFLWIFFRKTDFPQVWEGIKSANIPILVFSVIVGLSHNIFRCYRWRYLLEPVKKKVGFYNLLSTTIIGYMVSWIIPGRIGEVVRPVLLGQREGISKTSAIATIVIERFMDGLSVVFLFGGALLLNRSALSVQSAHLLKAATYGGLIFTAVSIAAFILLLMLVWKKDAIRAFTENRWANPRSKILRQLSQIFHSFLEGAAALKSIKILLITAFYSLIVWFVIGLGIWLSLKATHIPVSIPGTFMLLPLLVIGIAIPTPGGVGTYHEAMQLGLIGLFQVPRDSATSAAIVVHAITIIPVVILGFVFLWRDGLSFHSVSSIDAMSNRAGD